MMAVRVQDKKWKCPRPLETWNWYTISSVTSLWPKQASRPARIPGCGSECHVLMGRTAKSHCSLSTTLLDGDRMHVLNTKDSLLHRCYFHHFLMRQLRLREVKQLDQKHRARNWGIWGVKQDLLDSKAYAFSISPNGPDDILRSEILMWTSNSAWL